jgi:hypothetical protein
LPIRRVEVIAESQSLECNYFLPGLIKAIETILS